MSPSRPPPYLDQSGVRVMWLAQLAAAGLSPREVRGRRRHRAGCWVVRVTLDAGGFGLGMVKATITWPKERPESVSVLVTGPADSPHRYRSGALCMWFPADDASRRWTRHDGPVGLMAHVLAHLAREEWWRRTGEWAGEQAPHELGGAHRR